MFSNASGVVTLAVARTMMSWLLGRKRPRRRVEGDRSERVANVGDGQPVAGELGLVDVDAENLLAVAVDLYVGDAGHGGQHVDDLVFDQDRHVLDRHGVGGDRQPHHRVGIGVGLDDARRVHVVGKLVLDAAYGVAHVGGRDIEIDAVVELDGDAAAGDRTRSTRST